MTFLPGVPTCFNENFKLAQNYISLLFENKIRPTEGRFALRKQTNLRVFSPKDCPKLVWTPIMSIVN